MPDAVPWLLLLVILSFVVWRLHPTMSLNSPCCPSGSIGSGGCKGGGKGGGKDGGKGEVIALADGTRCYAVGPRRGAGAVVIVAHDIYGPASGRTFGICDKLSERLGSEHGGALVLLPFLFDDAWPSERPMLGAWPKLRYLFGRALFRRWRQIEPAFRCALLPLARRALGSSSSAGSASSSSARIALVGFCWGGWCNLRACAAFPGAFRGAVGFHPSPQLCWLHGDALAPLVRRARATPVCFLPGWNDPRLVKEGGLVQRTLSEAEPAAPSGASVFRTFARMAHGWVNRGDVAADARVREDVRLAMDIAVGFLRERLSLPPAAVSAACR